jgi:hypothetical protein
MAKALPLIVVGLVIAYGGVAELVDWFRSRARLRRVTAEIVGLHEPVATSPSNKARSAVFRFTTDDGEVVEAISTAWSWPVPRIGQRIPVTYDPADPQRSAEKAGVRVFKLLLSPLLIAFGLGLGILGLTFL